MLLLHIQLGQMFLDHPPGPLVKAADPGLIRTGDHISPAVHHVDVLPHNSPHFLHNRLGPLPCQLQPAFHFQFILFHIPYPQVLKGLPLNIPGAAFYRLRVPYID